MHDIDYYDNYRGSDGGALWSMWTVLCGMAERCGSVCVWGGGACVAGHRLCAVPSPSGSPASFRNAAVPSRNHSEATALGKCVKQQQK